jgi:hypothetical protein
LISCGANSEKAEENCRIRTIDSCEHDGNFLTRGGRWSMQEIGRRDYIGDDGNHYVVVEFKPSIVRQPIAGDRVKVIGTSQFRLSTGEELFEQSEDDVFEIEDTGVVIRPA